MILEFKTGKNNTYCRRKYIGIDTDRRVFSLESPRMIVEGIEIKTSDYKDLIIALKANNYEEVKHL